MKDPSTVENLESYIQTGFLSWWTIGSGFNRKWRYCLTHLPTGQLGGATRWKGQPAHHFRWQNPPTSRYGISKSTILTHDRNFLLVSLEWPSNLRTAWVPEGWISSVCYPQGSFAWNVIWAPWPRLYYNTTWDIAYPSTDSAYQYATIQNMTLPPVEISWD